MGKGSMLYKAVKMPHSTPGRAAGYSTTAERVIMAYRAKYSPHTGGFSLGRIANPQGQVPQVSPGQGWAGPNQFANTCFCTFLYGLVFVRLCTEKSF